jgi:hypothetical protein
MPGAAKSQKTTLNPGKSDQKNYKEKEAHDKSPNSSIRFAVGPPRDAGQNEVKLTLSNLTGLDLIALNLTKKHEKCVIKGGGAANGNPNAVMVNQT